ncbi:transcription initiation factor IID, 18kDa subunit, partial [Hysterangium stoloniferum]
RGPKKSQTLKGTFNRECRSMLYAFGDVKEPAIDTVDVLEEILMEYLVDVCHTALAPSRKTRIQIEDLRRALGRHADGKKLARLEELLFMQDDIRRAR